jgi:predicted HicB family RNase H-like nuclease
VKPRFPITLDPEVHQRARRYAAKKGTSVSSLIENLLRAEPRDSPSVVDEML